MIIEKNVGYWCKTEQLAKRFLQECEQQGYNAWCVYKSYAWTKMEGKYEEDTCYVMAEGTRYIKLHDKYWCKQRQIKIMEYKTSECNNINSCLIEIAREVIQTDTWEEYVDDNLVNCFEDGDYYEICKKIANNITEKLPELLADSEWVRLPCKVGKEVWFIRYYDNKLCKGKICSIIIREIEPLFEINVCDEFGSRVGTIGQTENIFYTQAEAEEKLAKLKE